MVVEVPRPRSGRADALTAAGDGSRNCTASQRARRPVTAPQASCVLAGVSIGPGGVTCGAAPPAVANSTTVPAASVTATVTTHNLRDRDFDILDHPAPRATAPAHRHQPLRNEGRARLARDDMAKIAPYDVLKGVRPACRGRPKRCVRPPFRTIGRLDAPYPAPAVGRSCDAGEPAGRPRSEPLPWTQPAISVDRCDDERAVNQLRRPTRQRATKPRRPQHHRPIRGAIRSCGGLINYVRPCGLNTPRRTRRHPPLPRRWGTSGPRRHRSSVDLGRLRRARHRVGGTPAGTPALDQRDRVLLIARASFAGSAARNRTKAVIIRCVKLAAAADDDRAVVHDFVDHVPRPHEPTMRPCTRNHSGASLP